MHAPVRDEVIQFRIPADIKYVPMVRKGASAIARSVGFTEAMAEDIELSVAEAIVNAIQHGSPERAGNNVVITCRFSADSLTVDVYDEGAGFELLAETDDGDPLAESGRGLRLIYRLMDSVKVGRRSKGSYVRMVKERREPTPARSVGQ